MIVRAITGWLIRQNAIKEEDEDLYEYAIRSLYYSVAPIILSLIIGVIMGQVRYGIILSIPLCLIRRYSGGYHAPYGWLCILMSVGLLLFCFLIQPYVQCNILLLVLTVLAILSLCILSPIDSKNRPLDQSEKKRYKKTTIVIALLCGVVYMITWMLGNGQIASGIATGIILAASLQLPCIPRILKEK